MMMNTRCVEQHVELKRWCEHLVQVAIDAGAEKAEVFLQLDDVSGCQWTPYRDQFQMEGLEGLVDVQVELDYRTFRFVSDCFDFPKLEREIRQDIGDLCQLPVGIKADQQRGERQYPVQSIFMEPQEGYSPAQAIATMQALQERFSASAFHLHRWEWKSAFSYKMLVKSAGEGFAYTQNRHSLGLLLEGEHGFLEEGACASNVQRLDLEALSDRMNQLLVWPREKTPIAPNRYALCLPPSIASEIVRRLGVLFSGPRLLRSAKLLDLLGKRVARSHLTLVDDALLAGGWNTRPHDDEGIPSQRTALIEKGVFQQFLHSVDTADSLGVASTGNVVRSANGRKQVGPSNIYLLPGTTDALQWRQQTTLGIELVHAVQPPFFVNQSGLLKFVADGWLIQAGERVRRLSSITVSLQPFRLLRNIHALGNDLSFFFYAKGAGSPSLYLEDVLVQEDQIFI